MNEFRAKGETVLAIGENLFYTFHNEFSVNYDVLLDF